MDPLDLFKLRVNHVHLGCPTTSEIVEFCRDRDGAPEEKAIQCARTCIKVDLVAKHDRNETSLALWSHHSPKWRSSHPFLCMQEEPPPMEQPIEKKHKAKSKKKVVEPAKVAEFKSSRYCLKGTPSLVQDSKQGVDLALLWTHVLRFSLLKNAGCDEENVESIAQVVVPLDSLFLGDCLLEELFELEVEDEFKEMLSFASVSISLAATEQVERMLLGSAMLRIEELRLHEDEVPEEWYSSLTPEGEVDKDTFLELQQRVEDDPVDIECSLELWPTGGYTRSVCFRMGLSGLEGKWESKDEGVSVEGKEEYSIQWHACLLPTKGNTLFLARETAKALAKPLQIRLTFQNSENTIVIDEPRFEFRIQESVPRKQSSVAKEGIDFASCACASTATVNKHLAAARHTKQIEEAQERMKLLQNWIASSNEDTHHEKNFVALNDSTCLRLAHECELQGEHERAELFWLESGDLIGYARTQLRRGNLKNAIGVLELALNRANEEEATSLAAGELLSFALLENGDGDNSFSFDQHSKQLRLAYHYSQTVLPEMALTSDECRNLVATAIDLKLASVADLCFRIANELETQPLIDEALVVNELLRAKLKAMYSKHTAGLKVLEALKHDYSRVDWDSVSDGLRLEYHVTTGRVYLDQKMHDSAKEEFATALTLLNKLPEPDFQLQALVYYYLGMLGISCGNPRATRLIFLQAAKKDPLCRYAWVWLLLGMAELSINEFEDADVALMKACNLDNLNPTIWFYSAVLNAKLSLEQEAKFALQTSLELGLKASYLKLDPSVAQYVNTLGHTLKKDKSVLDLRELFQ